MLTGMAFDPDDKRPLFERVVDDLRNDIKNGKLKPEERVPPARELSERYGIANMTAQRALRELQSQGLIYGVPGKGSFVRPDVMDKLFPEPTDVQTEDEYRAVLAEFQSAMDASGKVLDEAIASQDIEAIKAAKELSDKVLTEQYANMLGITYYSHRQRNPNFDAQNEARRAELQAEAAARKAARDKPKPRTADPDAES